MAGWEKKIGFSVHPVLLVFAGGDEISARFMRQDFFSFTPKFKLMIAGNHKPRIKTVDEAMRRRIQMILFSVTIPKEDRDPDLAEKLKTEWPAICARVRVRAWETMEKMRMHVSAQTKAIRETCSNL